jgi:hypothetical protein
MNSFIAFIAVFFANKGSLNELNELNLFYSLTVREFMHRGLYVFRVSSFSSFSQNWRKELKRLFW